ncbi:MAG: hypothetical protein ABJC13_15310 [Acidobacteriota bacterium]
MNPEVVKYRLVLDLDVVRGSRWRELAPFREAVLSHFANPDLRAELAVVCEAIADQMLEREEEDLAPGESWATARLRAVLADLLFSKKALDEILTILPDDDSIPNRQQLSQRAAALVRQLDRDLANLESDLGPPPE